MSKGAKLEINSKQFRRQVQAFGKKHNVMFKTVMTDQMRLYCTDLARRFPPSKKLFGKSALAAFQSSVGKLTDRRIGERAVELGVKSAIFVAKPRDLAFSQEHGEEAVRKFAPGKRLFKRHSDGAVWLVDETLFMPTADTATMETFHDGRRSKRTGHTTRAGVGGDRTIGRWKSSKLMHVTESGLKKYLKLKKKSVGKLKGGWIAGIRRFGGKDPAGWIRRHAGGSAGGQINDKGNGRLWAVNNVPYASRYRKVQKFALRVRRKDLAKQAKKRLRKLVQDENRRKTA